MKKYIYFFFFLIQKKKIYFYLNINRINRYLLIDITSKFIFYNIYKKIITNFKRSLNKTTKINLKN